MASSQTVIVDQRQFDNIEVQKVSITDVGHLASYNWIEAPTPTIAVPGTPSRRTPPAAPQKLGLDTGFFYIAQNAARHPESPLEPLFRALYIENPSFDISSVDVVTDRNNIRKLLSFINPSLDQGKAALFTIHAEVIKNTVILSRAETETHEFIGPGQFRGFGHNFEKRYTTPTVKGSTGHHRIITYNLGGLKFVVRHETDGYVVGDTPVRSVVAGQSKQESLLSLSALGSLSLSEDDPSVQDTRPSTKLTIIKAGNVIPLESTLEIKTRTIKRYITVDEVSPQLWILQTPKLVRAYHQSGRFIKPEVEDVTGAVKKWEGLQQADLNKLTALLKEIIEAAKKLGGTATIRKDAQKRSMTIEKSERGRMLPEDLYSKWLEA
ncbi:hypothetical protein N7475_008154 [Penicillium sp. IBT 31633x]|nr:hypothetical protein N7475_008154 [Penicillium sp. IBT 31633x]